MAISSTPVQQFGTSISSSPLNPTLTATPGSSIGSGSLLVATLRQYLGTMTAAGPPTGGGVTTWIAGPTDNNIHDWTAAIWYGISAGGSSAVAVVLSGNSLAALFDVAEFSGFAGGVNVVGTPANSSGTNANAVTLSTTPGVGKNVLVVACYTGQPPGTSATPSGWTAGTNGGAGQTPWIYQVVATTTSGAISLTWAGGYSRYGAAGPIAFEPVSAGPTANAVCLL